MANEQETNQGGADAPDEEGFDAAFAERMGGDKIDDQAEAPAVEEKADASDASEPAAAEEVAAQPGSQFDPWAGMSPEQRSHWERVQHSDQSQRGRVAALTRKLDTRPAQQAPEPRQQSEEAQPDNRQPESADDLEARVQASLDDYPDAVGPLAEKMAKEMEALRTKMTGMQAQLEPVAEDRESQSLAQEYALLEKSHPDYREIGSDQSYIGWVNDQPKSIQDLAVSYSAGDVSKVLTLFKAERAASQQPTATDTKRERQLEGSRAVPRRSAPTVAGVPDDFDAAFNARAATKR